MFLLNSRLGLFTAAPQRGRPFSRSYRTILPSSLAMNHSSALGYSPRLPVSVYGTVCFTRYFLEPLTYFRFDRSLGSAYISVSTQASGRSVTFVVSRYRNINLFPIRYPFRVFLRDRLTLNRLALFRKP